MTIESDMECGSGSVPTLTTDDSTSGTSGSSDSLLSASNDHSTTYQYTDYGHVEDDEDTHGLFPVALPSCHGLNEASIRAQKFPAKLYSILSEPAFAHIITWLPHGRSWKILDQSLFRTVVLPLYFEYQNFHSFNRLVNAWAFRRVGSGAGRGAYYNDLFLRGKPHLQKYMRRLPKTQKKIPKKKGSPDPDFYALDKKCPLPPLKQNSSAKIYIPAGPSSPQAQPQLLLPHLVTPPVPGPYVSLQTSAHAFTPDMLTLFDESKTFSDSMMNQMLHIPSPCHMEPSYLGRGVPMLPSSPTPLATESFFRLQEQQQREQEDSKQLVTHQYHMQQLHQMSIQSQANISLLDFASAYEPHDCHHGLLTSFQHNHY